MKTLYTLFLALLSFNFSYSQVMVSDLGLMKYLTGTDAKKAASDKSRFLTQLGEIKRQAEFLKEAKENYDKVNSNIRRTAQVRVILYKQDRLVNSTLYNLETIRSSKLSLQAKERAVRSLINNREMAEDLFRMVKQLINSYDLKMNDSERLQYLSEIEKKIDKSQAQISGVNKKVQRLDRLNQIYDRN